MGKEDRKLQISDFEHGLLINGMLAFRNQLLEEGKPTEDVNDLTGQGTVLYPVYYLHHILSFFMLFP